MLTCSPEILFLPRVTGFQIRQILLIGKIVIGPVYTVALVPGNALHIILVYTPGSPELAPHGDF
jgi:hypothetical protein